MIHIDLNALDATSIYKLLSGSIIPRPVAWVTTLNEDGVLNAAPFSFFNAAGGPFVSLSIGRNEGKLKDTSRNLLNLNEAVIHITDLENVNDMSDTAINLPSDTSEVDYFKLETVASHSVKVPGLKNARIRLEATLHQHIELENNGFINDFFLLKVTDIHLAHSVFDEGKNYILVDKLEPVARLSGNDYAKLGDIFTINRKTKATSVFSL